MKTLTPLLMTIATLALQTFPLQAGPTIEQYLESGKSGDFNYSVYHNAWLRGGNEGVAEDIPRVAITGVSPGAKGEIEIPSSIDGYEVYGIDDGAFKATPGIRTISIPKTVRWLRPGTLNRCQSLEYIDIADDHPDFASVDGVMFDKRKATLLSYPAGRRGEYKFPASATAIGQEAFSLNQNLKSLSIPASVTDIGGRKGWVFSGCINLERVDLPETVTNIGQASFHDCKRLQEITIPPKVTAIPFGLFWGCGNLIRVTLPDGITSIGNYAFAGCTTLTLPRLPESLTTIGAYAFKDCKGLKGLEVPESVTDIETGAFLGTAVEIPASPLNPDNARKLARVLNGNLSGITALDSPDSVAIAEALATYEGRLSLPNLKRISPQTLAALIKKEDVEIPPVETLELIPEPDGSPTDDFVIPEGFKERHKQQQEKDGPLRRSPAR